VKATSCFMRSRSLLLFRPSAMKRTARSEWPRNIYAGADTASCRQGAHLLRKILLQLGAKADLVGDTIYITFAADSLDSSWVAQVKTP
jgi:hypothetical protein